MIAWQLFMYKSNFFSWRTSGRFLNDPVGWSVLDIDPKKIFRITVSKIVRR